MRLELCWSRTWVLALLKVLVSSGHRRVRSHVVLGEVCHGVEKIEEAEAAG